jgi:hypothetical protein
MYNHCFYVDVIVSKGKLVYVPWIEATRPPEARNYIGVEYTI